MLAQEVLPEFLSSVDVVVVVCVVCVQTLGRTSAKDDRTLLLVAVDWDTALWVA